MLKPQNVVDTYYLEARCMLLEIAALFDRYDAAVQRAGKPAQDERKLQCLRQALQLTADPNEHSNRTEKLLNLFADIPT
ncbi:MAG: hypothetical protein O3C57_03320 [Verrucomicrobia bacterium]|nr:hypothetical protein [Verrucomicrobiota bacterium]